MKNLMIILFLSAGLPSQAQLASQQEENKKIALKFYHDLWENPTTDKYAETVADTYIVHDIGDRKGVVEEAVRQKEIADFFWKHGTIDFELDYQVASEDRVVTRWIINFTPKTLFGKLVLRKHSIPIINVFRIENGKIVEIWNHRHDIDTSQTDKFMLGGLAAGLVIAVVPFGFMIYYRRKWKRNKVR